MAGTALRLPTSAALLAALALPLAAQRPGDRLLVCNKSADTVSVFDVVSRAEVATLPTGAAPHEVAISPDGCTAVVTNYGRQRAGRTLTVVDVRAGEVRSTVALAPDPAPAPRPHGVAFAAKDLVWVTAEGTRQLLQVDLRRGAVVRARPTGDHALHLLACTGGELAATSPTTGVVAFVGAEPDRPVHAAVPAGAEGVAVHPRTGAAWVADRLADTVSIVSPVTGEVTRRLDTGRAPRRVAFTPGGRRALVTCVTSGELMVFDARTGALLGEVSIHGDRSEQSSLPLDVACGADGRRAYVTCARGEFVAVVDLQKVEVVDRIDTRPGPDGVAYARPSTAKDEAP